MTWRATSGRHYRLRLGVRVVVVVRRVHDVVRALRQGLTLVHFSAQRKRILWDRGCIKGLFRGCSGAI